MLKSDALSMCVICARDGWRAEYTRSALWSTLLKLSPVPPRSDVSSHFKMLTERVRHTIRLTLHAEFEFKMTKFEDMTIHELCVEYFRMIVYSENNTSSVGTWADRCAGEYPLVTA